MARSLRPAPIVAAEPKSRRFGLSHSPQPDPSLPRYFTPLRPLYCNATDHPAIYYHGAFHLLKAWNKVDEPVEAVLYNIAVVSLPSGVHGRVFLYLRVQLL